MTARALWRVERALPCDLAKDSSGVPVIRNCEWVRIFLGRAISFANVIGEGNGAEYLVLGRTLDEIPDDQVQRLRSIIELDFAVLGALIAKHREFLASHDKSAHAEMFTRAYATLRHVTVPDDVCDWVITDEGLTIVRWGTRGNGRPLLAWTAVRLEEQKRQLFEAHPRLGKSMGVNQIPVPQVRGRVEVIQSITVAPVPLAPVRRPTPSDVATPTGSVLVAGAPRPQIQARPSSVLPQVSRRNGFVEWCQSPYTWITVSAAVIVVVLLFVLVYRGKRIPRASSETTSVSMLDLQSAQKPSL